MCRVSGYPWRAGLAISIVGGTLAAATPASAFGCLTGAALGVALAGPIVSGAVGESGCNFVRAPHKKALVGDDGVAGSRACARAEWDALQGYVQVRKPCP